MKKFKQNIRVVWQIIRRDLQVLYETSLKDDIINALLLTFFFILVFGFMGTFVGLQQQVAVDSFLGTVTSISLFTCFIRSLQELADLEFTKFIDYRRTLPLTKRWFLLAQIMSTAIHCLFVIVPVLILGKILLWQPFSFAHTNWFAVIGTIISSTITFAAFFSCIQYTVSFEWFKFNIWQRVFAPLQHLGCMFYSWKKAYIFSPWFARCLLLNPMTYLTEGTRASFLGSTHYVPVVFCMPIIFLLMSGLLLLLTTKIVKRLDWV